MYGALDLTSLIGVNTRQELEKACDKIIAKLASENDKLPNIIVHGNRNHAPQSQMISRSQSSSKLQKDDMFLLDEKVVLFNNQYLKVKEAKIISKEYLNECFKLCTKTRIKKFKDLFMRLLQKEVSSF